MAWRKKNTIIPQYLSINQSQCIFHLFFFGPHKHLLPTSKIKYFPTTRISLKCSNPVHISHYFEQIYKLKKIQVVTKISPPDYTTNTCENYIFFTTINIFIHNTYYTKYNRYTTLKIVSITFRARDQLLLCQNKIQINLQSQNNIKNNRRS